MSRIKELKNKDLNKINIIDFYQRIVNSDKTKYLELVEKLMDKFLEENITSNSFIKEVCRDITNFDYENLSYFETILLECFSRMGIIEKFICLNKFIDYNERNLIEKNDLTTYKSFNEIENQVNIADIKSISKDMEKQVLTLLNDDTWIVVKPLSFESSKKYGSNTKWCTTMVTEPSYFYKYFRNGILIYCINKNTGYKVAVYKRLSEKETSFWDQKDNRIDSFETELTGEIINILKKDFKECKKSNYDLADSESIKREMGYYNMIYKDNVSINEEQHRRVTINNMFDETDEPELPNPPIDENLTNINEGIGIKRSQVVDFDYDEQHMGVHLDQMAEIIDNRVIYTDDDAIYNDDEVIQPHGINVRG